MLLTMNHECRSCLAAEAPIGHDVFDRRPQRRLRLRDQRPLARKDALQELEEAGPQRILEAALWVDSQEGSFANLKILPTK
jgi:hypothetical protein